MEDYRIVITPRAARDIACYEDLERKNLEVLLKKIQSDPYYNSDQLFVLVGAMAGTLSRRINRIDRLVYQVYEETKVIKIIIAKTQFLV